jgi:hypothetical protein
MRAVGACVDFAGLDMGTLEKQQYPWRAKFLDVRRDGEPAGDNLIIKK